MNKKVDDKAVKQVYDDKEDLEIKNVAYYKNTSQKLLLVILIIIFFLVFIAAVLFINNYYVNKLKENSLAETIEVRTNDTKVIVINRGEIEEEITNSYFEKSEEIKIEKINTIELITNKEAKEDGYINFDIKYYINKNDFKLNEIATNNSNVLVRFSYSFDNEEWTYVKNVISTNDSTLSPLMGNYYDVSGIKTTLNVMTNFELTSKIGESNKMYWRSETIFSNKNELELNNNYQADFKIEI